MGQTIKRNTKMKPISAKNLKGIIIQDSFNNVVFRVHRTSDDFTDYDLKHLDISVEILDDDAYIYGDYIDYSPQTLGYKD